ncbi:phage protein [Oceanobacillus picturae]|uniref:Phage protein n=1 Tax=Oceanobacillus picturae TaxID=171693 RepID=A0A0U9H6C0_9BACI|nr:phage protein [Oceanobacillus picturae]
MSLKSKIYKMLRIWNDVDAVRKGKVGKRVGRRVAGKASGKMLRKLFK